MLANTQTNGETAIRLSCTDNLYEKVGFTATSLFALKTAKFNKPGGLTTIVIYPIWTIYPMGTECKCQTKISSNSGVLINLVPNV